jgi:hypothetical protein
VLHEGGLAKSVEATVAKRYGRIFSSIIEVCAILEDYRIDTIGGLKCGFEIFEIAILPSLLHNSDTWASIEEPTLTRLENLQKMMYRNLFAVPNSTPIPMLRLDLGSITMQERIHQIKLNFIYHLKTLNKGSLASEIYEIQAKYDLPGLVKECRQLMRLYDLPDVIDGNVKTTKVGWKNMVRKAIKRRSQKNLQEEVRKYSKLRGKYETEDLLIKSYIKEMNLRQARTMFRVRSSMLDTKMNQKSNPKYAAELWKCDDCLSMDSQSHILWCPAYAPLREGKNLYDNLDLVDYYQQVMKIREETAK